MIAEQLLTDALRTFYIPFNGTMQKYEESYNITLSEAGVHKDVTLNAVFRDVPSSATTTAIEYPPAITTATVDLPHQPRGSSPMNALFFPLPLKCHLEQGVWPLRLSDFQGGADGVGLLRAYLLDNWTGSELPLTKATGNQRASSVYPYSSFNHTSAPYEEEAQLQNTLRVRGEKRRLKGVRDGLPGFNIIEDVVRTWIRETLFTKVKTCEEINTWEEMIGLFKLQLPHHQAVRRSRSRLRLWRTLRQS
jgi:hypothetical protein